MLRERLSEALKTALRSKDARRVSTLRLILAAIKDRDIAARGEGKPGGISDEQISGLLQTMVRQRRDSIALFEQGGRLELAEQEKEEIVIIEDYLPRQMGDDEIMAAVKTVLGELNARALKDMGRVMAALRERYAGQMDFGKASQIAKSQLT
ncbi:MAG: GatB/YqeY domain-containing protein [Alphaproteobacteria bacterium]|nr:GatB/YqeY domain-containing protein [Alphaproteobacteria bacterium]